MLLTEMALYDKEVGPLEMFDKEAGTSDLLADGWGFGVPLKNPQRGRRAASV